MEQQAEREQATRRQYEHMRTQLQAATESTRESASLLGAALADRRDVLRLIDVMSTSPESIKVVLEAYLKKLGESTGSVPVKFGISEDGRSISVSERISIALTIKRRQEGESREKAAEQEQPLQEQPVLQEPLSMQKWHEVQDTMRRASPSKEHDTVEVSRRLAP
mmetsp:Transcript_29766/g.67505  ORF Transcript_29766/g.67505 Transcript_29766/m.67505 type:complete len:165 (-) Transcript_29766:45-539(-)